MDIKRQGRASWVTALGLFTLTTTAQAAAIVPPSTLLIASSGSASTYIYPQDPANAVLKFVLPDTLLGAQVVAATFSFTGMTYGSATGEVRRVDSAAGDATLVTDLVFPFNFGSAYAHVDVTAAASAWLGDGTVRRPNEGLRLVATSGGGEVVTELHPAPHYAPTLSIEYQPGAYTPAATRLVAAAPVFSADWSFDDLATLLDLYAAGGGSAVVDGETWYYTATEYSQSGAWGGPHALGDAWVDALGYKHIYLGSGVTTAAPAAVPVPGAGLLFAPAVLALARRRRR